jgi:hypothetical protein
MDIDDYKEKVKELEDEIASLKEELEDKKGIIKDIWFLVK